MRYFLVLLFLAFGAVWAEDDLREEAQKYLKDNSTEVDGVRFMKWWNETSNQMQRDNPFISGEDVAADTYIFNYVADRKKKLKPDEDVKLTKEEKIKLCRFYLLYKIREWKFPEKIKPMITKAHYDSIINDKPLPGKIKAEVITIDSKLIPSLRHSEER